MTATNHIKLGLLALAGLAGVVVVGVALGLRGTGAETTSYHTYFDESVQGLDLGAPVKYRGVKIGSVETIAVAPDRQHVDVGLAIGADEARRLALATSSELRAQLVSQGLTGVKFVELDVVDPAREDAASGPRPPLPFPTAAHYVPARRSTLKGLEDNLQVVGERLPALIDRAVATLGKVERVVDDISGQGVPGRIAEAVAAVGGAAGDVRRLAQRLDGVRLGDRAAGMIGRVDAAADRLTQVLAQLDGDRGLIASTRRAADALGDAGTGARGSTIQLERTLRQIGDAAMAVRELVEEIDREPDMLVKGRARSEPTGEERREARNQARDP